MRRAPLAPTAVVVSLMTAVASGQWVEQVVPLNSGWNTVFLEVDPAPQEADRLFAGQPFETVWFRVALPVRQLGDECDGPEDLDCLQTNDTQWRVWMPPGPASAIVTSLRVIRGGRVYFIKATAATTWTVTGRPTAAVTQYLEGFNAVGFHVDPSAPPTFDAFLASEPALNDLLMYRVLPAGAVVPVARSSGIQPKHGFWALSSKTVEYGGPVSIDRASLSGLDFGTVITSLRVEAQNRGGSQGGVAMIVRPSAPVPATTPPQPIKAGDVPIFWRDYGGGSLGAEILQWRSLTNLTIAESPFALNVGVKRAGLPVASTDRNFQGGQYQSVLEVSDGAGYRRFLGITAEVLDSAGNEGATASTASGATGARPGLYVGSVSIEQVAWITAGARTWTNDDAGDPTFATVLRCNGGTSADQACFPDRKRCVGTPELELQQLTCDSSVDCPPPGSCAVITDCPGGICTGFCIGGSRPEDSCSNSAGCGKGGVCSADIETGSLRPVTFPFEFRVILHLSETGEAKMLTEVAFLADDTNALVLATPDCAPSLCDTLDGALIINNRRFSQRISTPAFSLDGDLPLSGSFNTQLTGSFTIAPDDPLNPFRHLFHPDGDCDLPGECYEITRAFVFDFELTPPTGISDLRWGDTVVGGVLTEQVSGLHREAIAAQGRFELERISDVGVLNTPVGGGGLP